MIQCVDGYCVNCLRSTVSSLFFWVVSALVLWINVDRDGYVHLTNPKPLYRLQFPRRPFSVTLDYLLELKRRGVLKGFRLVKCLNNICYKLQYSFKNGGKR